jgi:hypothetical protein
MTPENTLRTNIPASTAYAAPAGAAVECERLMSALTPFLMVENWWTKKFEK